VVICERYVDSALAYLEAGRTLPVDEVAWLCGWATGALKPDLVVLLDIEPAEGLRRADHRPEGGPDADTLQFAERVRYAFLDRSAKDPNRYLVLDASRPAESVATLIVDRVERLLPAVPRSPAAPPVDAPPDDDAAAPDSGPPAELGANTAPLVAGPLTTVEPPGDGGSTSTERLSGAETRS
jgi:dTMP kinase